MQRTALHPEACTLVREWNLCSLSSEFYQTPTHCCHWQWICVGVWVWEGRGEKCQCAGVTSVSKQPGAQACVFDLASAKLARALFHGQHVARGINTRKWCLNSPVAFRKEQYYSPESRLHSLTQTLLLARTWCTKSHSQTHKLMLLCWAPHFLASGLRRSTGVQSSGVHDCNIGSAFQIHSCSPSYIPTTHPPLAARLWQLY